MSMSASTSQPVIVITDKYNDRKKSIKQVDGDNKKTNLKIIRAALELTIERHADNNIHAIFNKPSIAGYRQRVENQILAFLLSDEKQATINGAIYDCQDKKEYGVEVHIERINQHKPAYL